MTDNLEDQINSKEKRRRTLNRRIGTVVLTIPISGFIYGGTNIAIDHYSVLPAEPANYKVFYKAKGSLKQLENIEESDFLTLGDEERKAISLLKSSLERMTQNPTSIKEIEDYSIKIKEYHDKSSYNFNFNLGIILGGFLLTFGIINIPPMTKWRKESDKIGGEIRDLKNKRFISIPQ